MGKPPLISGRRAVFFDRDGVLNRAEIRNGRPFPARALSAALEDGVEAALTRLARVIPLMFVVTNQPDVARKTLLQRDVERVNEFLARRLPLTAFYTCYHDDDDGCTCRKPQAGLFVQAADDYGVDLSSSYLVGDRWRDIDGGAAAGTTTIFVDRHYRERAATNIPDIHVSSTVEAVDAIIASEANRERSKEMIKR